MSKTQGAFSKADFLLMYGVKMPMFESWIVDIMEEVGWKKGVQQKFPPNMARKILAHLGDPIPSSDLNKLM